MTASVVYGVMLVVALIATVTDTRSGRIPNWLTLPVVVLAPAAHFVLGGNRAGLASLVGIVVCGFAPLIFFRLGAMGGGDVKVFAALGALSGPQLGLEIELVSMGVAMLYGLLLVARKGGALKLLKNSLFVAANVFLPESRKYEVEAGEMTSIRIGGSIFAGTLLCVTSRAIAFGI